MSPPQLLFSIAGEPERGRLGQTFKLTDIFLPFQADPRDQEYGSVGERLPSTAGALSQLHCTTTRTSFGILSATLSP